MSVMRMNVAVAVVGATGKMDTSNLQEAIVAFVFGEKGPSVK